MSATQSCNECGSTFPSDEMVAHGSIWVCAGCKPVFLQRLQEGIGVSTKLRYAGFWIRFGAKFLDGIILQILGFFIGLVMGMVGQATGAQILFMILNLIIVIGIGVAYTTYFIGKHGATPGKMACGLRVVTPEGENVTYGRALGRHFAEMLSSLTLFIGFIMAAFDPEKQALHDRICGTRVIYK